MKKLSTFLVAIMMIALTITALAQKEPTSVVQSTFNIALESRTVPTITIGSEVSLSWLVSGSSYHGRLSVLLQGETPGTDVGIITPCYKGANSETCNDRYVSYGNSHDQITFYVPSSTLPGRYKVRVSIMDYDSTTILADDTTRSFEVLAQPATIKWLRDGVSFTWPAGTLQNIKVLTDGLQGNWLSVSLVDINGASVPGYSRYLFGTNVLDGISDFAFNVPASVEVGRYYLRFESYDYMTGDSTVRTEDSVVINVTSAVTAPSMENKLVAGRSYRLRWNTAGMSAEHVMIHMISSKGYYWHAFVATVIADKGTAVVRIPFSVPSEAGDVVQFMFSSPFMQQFRSEGYTVVGGRGKLPDSSVGIGGKE